MPKYSLQELQELNDDVASQLKLAKYFKEKDPQKFYEYSRIAAEKGSAEGSYNLGICYKNGYGQVKDKNLSFYWFNIAANARKNYAAAQFELGEIFYEDKKIDLAIENYILAAGNGESRASFKLGKHYYENKQFDQAINFFSKSANAGNPDSQYFLGKCYSKGKVIAENTKESLMYYTLAAYQDHVKAQNILDGWKKILRLEWRNKYKIYKDLLSEAFTDPTRKEVRCQLIAAIYKKYGQNIIDDLFNNHSQDLIAIRDYIDDDLINYLKENEGYDISYLKLETKSLKEPSDEITRCHSLPIQANSANLEKPALRKIHSSGAHESDSEAKKPDNEPQSSPTDAARLNYDLSSNVLGRRG